LKDLSQYCANLGACNLLGTSSELKKYVSILQLVGFELPSIRALFELHSHERGVTAMMPAVIWQTQLTWDRKAPGSYGGAPKATFYNLAGELQCEVVLPNNFLKIRDFHLSVFKATKSSVIKDVLPPSAFPLHCGFFACTAGLSI